MCSSYNKTFPRTKKLTSAFPYVLIFFNLIFICTFTFNATAKSWKKILYWCMIEFIHQVSNSVNIVNESQKIDWYFAACWPPPPWAPPPATPPGCRPTTVPALMWPQQQRHSTQHCRTSNNNNNSSYNNKHKVEHSSFYSME